VFNAPGNKLQNYFECQLLFFELNLIVSLNKHLLALKISIQQKVKYLFFLVNSKTRAFYKKME
jgi:hypothetical protein